MTPVPVSKVTPASVVQEFVCATVTLISPPFGLNLMAFESKFSITRSIREASQWPISSGESATTRITCRFVVDA